MEDQEKVQNTFLYGDFLLLAKIRILISYVFHVEKNTETLLSTCSLTSGLS